MFLTSNSVHTIDPLLRQPLWPSFLRIPLLWQDVLHNKKIIKLKTIEIHLTHLCKHFQAKKNVTLPPSSPLGYFTINNNITLFKCNRTLQVNTPKTFLKNTSCGYDIFMGPPHSDDVSQGSLAACSMVQLPMNGFAVSANPFAFLTAEISVQFLPSDECMQCHHYRGHCHLDSQRKVNCAQRYISNS